MNQQTDNQDNEDVVVIEERDNKTLLYIVIAGVLGVALGGLLGSTLTAQNWQSTYLELEQQYQTLTEDKQQLVVKVEQKVAEVDNEIEQKLQQAIVDQQAEHTSEIEALQQQLQELEKVNLSLEQQLGEQKQQLESATAQNSRLNRQADMQATMFERSRELFQQELKVKQQLEALEQEREELGPRIEELKKACDLYLEGTSWEAKSDSCDKQDEASSRLSQVEQMIRVHQLDLKQIDALSEELGL